MKKTFYLIFVLIATLNLVVCYAQTSKNKIATRWTSEKANEWYKQWGWLRGSDFIPSTAINQLEMWQAESFDAVTIDRELGWAESIGMNIMRVYLHHLAWETDPQGFKSRMEKYLAIADKHKISTLFVFFDDCWNPVYHAGKQPDPKPGVHNSGWVRDPGNLGDDTTHYPVFERYVKDVLTHFANDKRIVLWDLYNEPGNSDYGNKSMRLLKKVYQWAREVNPSQPISSGVWNKSLVDLNIFHKATIDSLRKYNRPLLCTEYMARRNNSTFANIMPLLKAEKVAAINWGLVAGKTNTMYAWDTPMPDGKEPKLWFHDIFRKDGTPYQEDEVKLIRQLTGK